jgi:hypothetical protein
VGVISAGSDMAARVKHFPRNGNPLHFHWTFLAASDASAIDGEQRWTTKGRKNLNMRRPLLGATPSVGTLRAREETAPATSKRRPIKGECQETYLTVGSVSTLFCFGIQPNRLNVHS